MAWIRQTLLLSAGIFAALLLGLSWLGFPGFLSRWVLAAANEGGYFIVAYDVKLDLRGGLKASDVEVYRKGVVGSPFIEAREIRIIFRVFDRARRGVSRIKEVRARGGIIRPVGRGGLMAWDMPVTPANGHMAGKDTGQARMTVFLVDCDVMGVWVESMQASLSIDHDGGALSQATGRVGRDLQRGSLEGSMTWKRGGKADGRLLTTFDPRALLPVCRLIHPDAVPILERFSFASTPPRIELSFDSDPARDVALKITGRMQATQYAYRGVGIGFVNISCDYVHGNGTNRLRLDPFLMVVGGRNAEGVADFNFIDETADFELVSGIDLAAALRLVGLKEQMLESWNLGDGARLMAKGRIDYRAPEHTWIDASVEGAGIAFGQVQAGECGFHYSSRGMTNQFADIRGKIGSGSFSGFVLLAPDLSGTKRTSRIKAELMHLDVDDGFKLLTTNPAWRAEGKMYGTVELAGEGGGGRMWPETGQGQLTLRNTHMFRLPLFAGFMKHLDRIIPGLDFFGSPVDVHFSFEVRHGRVVSRDIQIDDGPASITAQGSCGLDGSLDFIVNVQLMKKPGFLGQAIAGLFPKAKGIEFALTGTLASPKWETGERR